MNKNSRNHIPQSKDVLINRPAFRFLFFVGLVFVLPNTLGLTYKSVIPREGEIAVRDVIAPFSFDVEKPHDSLQIEIALARRSVPIILNFSHSISESVIASFDTMWSLTQRIIRSKKIAENQKVDSISHILKHLTTGQIQQLLFISNPADFHRVIRAGLKLIYNRGFVSSDIYESKERNALFSIRQNNKEKTQPAIMVMNDSSAAKELATYFTEQFPKDNTKSNLALSVARHFLIPNLVFDREETEKLMSSAEKKVSNIKFHISKDERIVARHQKIDHETYLKLKTLYDIQHGRSYGSKLWERVAQFFSAIITIFAIAGLYAEMLRRLCPNIWNNPRRMNLLFMALLVTAVISNILILLGASFYSVPVCFASAVTSYLYGGWISFTAGLVSLLLTLIGIGGDAPFAVASIIACGIISFGAGKSAARRKFISTILLSAAIGTLFILLHGWVSLILSQALLIRCLEFLIATVFSVMLAYFALPIAEKVTRDSSELSLSDMTNVNSVILQKLAVEAPGTFHHSMLVGNMSAAAAEAIGANPILAQAGGYYHDIGKLLHPQYFIENLEGKHDPHKDISLSQSALIISSHPANGVEIARTNGFPEPVIEIIEQHHGNTLVEFFYRQAREKDPSVPEEQFRYPGPKPQRVETAIVMICDIIEAYFRAHGGVPEKPQKLMWKLVERKILDGQFDECEISIRQIKMVLEKIEPILKGAYHKRISYPVDFLNEEYESVH